MVVIGVVILIVTMIVIVIIIMKSVIGVAPSMRIKRRERDDPVSTSGEV